MPLDRAQAARLQKWILATNVQARCPACGGNEFAPGEIVSVPPHEGRVGDPVVMVQLVCGGCAYVMLFAAGPVGLA